MSMQKMGKEQQQIAMLAAMLLVIVGVLGYFYRDNFLPKPAGELSLQAPPQRMRIIGGDGKDLYESEEFMSLKRFGDVPVRPIDTGGSNEPFVTETKTE